MKKKETAATNSSPEPDEHVEPNQKRLRSFEAATVTAVP